MIGGLSLWEDFAASDLGACAEEMLEILGRPTALRVPGRDGSRRRILVTLMHGNEPSGVRALHRWLHTDPQPAVDAWCVLASVEAALQPPRFTHRNRAQGKDLNRLFRPPFAGLDGELACAILRFIRATSAEALVDLHNNTGHNPPYAIATRIDPLRLRLTSYFATRFVHSNLRLGALMEAIEEELPSVTIECGRAGDPRADEVAEEGIRRFFSAERFEPDQGLASRLEILETPIRVCVGQGLRLAVGDAADQSADVTIAADLDRHNFEQMEDGTRLGWVRAGQQRPIVATDAAGRDCSSDLFLVRNGELRSRGSLIPIMMTTDPAIAVQDCLFYIVRRRASG